MRLTPSELSPSVLGLSRRRARRAARKARRIIARTARVVGLRELARSLERSVPGAILKDLVPGGATITKVCMVIARRLSRRDLPLAHDAEFGQLLTAIRQLATAPSAVAHFATSDELDLTRVLGTYFFGDDGPAEFARTRREYYGDLFAGNPDVFALWTPFAAAGDTVPCGSTVVVPLMPNSFHRYAEERTESQFQWNSAELASHDQLIEAGRNGELAKFGLYVQAVGIVENLRRNKQATLGICAQALLHLLHHLDGVPIRTAADMPTIYAEGTTDAGRALMRRWSLFEEREESVNGNPLFEINKRLLFDLRGPLGDLARSYFGNLGQLGDPGSDAA